MSMRPSAGHAVPTTTAQVARAAFPKGCLAIRIRDSLGELFEDEQFVELYATRGRPAVSPARLVLVLVLQAEEATETLLPLAERHGVTIETAGDIAPTLGSHALLLQMTTNLVHNAIVHNLPEQGTVWVSTSVRPKSVMLTVENTGDKLSPQLVSTLTEPFQRGTERLRNDHAGVGLGLAIVKSITQAHEGTVTITPRTGGGLHVTVQLPATTTRTGRLNHPRFWLAPISTQALGRNLRAWDAGRWPGAVGADLVKPSRRGGTRNHGRVPTGWSTGARTGCPRVLRVFVL
jgi:hypothetical protein